MPTNFPAQRLQLPLFHVGNVLAVQQNLSLSGIVDADNGSGAAGFAAAGLAYQSQRFSLFQGKAYMVNSVDYLAPSGLKMLGQVLYFQHRRITHFPHLPYGRMDSVLWAHPGLKASTGNDDP